MCRRLWPTRGPAFQLKVLIANYRDENEQKKIISRPDLFSTFVSQFSYLLQDLVSVFIETEEGVSHPFLQDPVFIRDKLVFIPF